MTPTGATLSATVIPNQDSALVYFEYGLTTNYGSQTSQQQLASGTSAVPITAGLSNLLPGQVYHFHMVTVTAQGTVFSADQTFATPGAPLVVTGSTAGAGQTGISLDGMVNPLGADTTYVFAYGPDTNFEFQTTPQDVGSGIAAVPVSTGINGLSPNTTYHLRLVATNNFGTTIGDEQVITTLPLGSNVVQPTFTYLNTGVVPDAGVLLGSDGNFYGTTNGGGLHGSGTAFQLSPAGTLRTLANFTGGASGLSPQASLVQGVDGNYYGTTQSGGVYSLGTIFMVSPSGVFTTVASLNSTTGTNPIAGLIVGADNSLYGVCQSGGSSGSGTVFKVTLSGTVTTLVNFSGTTGAVLGSSPKGNLTLGSDGNFYGTTSSGGTGTFGTVFKMTPAGVLTTLVNFTGTTGAALGSAPLTPLVQGPDGNFYGTTNGGTSNLGTAFVMTPAGVLTTLVNFTGTTGATLGSAPRGNLALGSDGNYYGTTQTGGTANLGTVFQLTPAGVLTTLVNFTGTTGASLGSAPLSGLIVDNAGNFYGACSTGDLYNQGNVFQLAPDGTLSTIIAFNTPPVIGKLLQGNDGNFYATTTAGGGNVGYGTVDERGPVGGALAKLANLVPTSGTSALTSQGGLIQGSGGELLRDLAIRRGRQRRIDL